MSGFMSQYLVPIAIGAVAIVLVLGLINMMRGGSPNTSQKLMRMRRRHHRDHGDDLADGALVSRFRSSHEFAARAVANFGIKGTLALHDSSAAFEPEVCKSTCPEIVRTSGSRHQAPYRYGAARRYSSFFGLGLLGLAFGFLGFDAEALGSCSCALA
jgi:hypothetical protein